MQYYNNARFFQTNRTFKKISMEINVFNKFKSINWLLYYYTNKLYIINIYFMVCITKLISETSKNK